jgi:hypothetical protein
MENSLSPISNQINSDIYYSPTPRRKWELSYGGKDKFYLTENEAKAFLQAVSGGAERVQVGVMNLTRWYKYLVPVKGLNNQGLPPELPKISDQQRVENRNRIKLLKEKFKP